jgi:hypothetical protein
MMNWLTYLASEAARIAAELLLCTRNDAIATRSVKDRDASFHANLIRDFGVTYTGPVRQRPDAGRSWRGRLLKLMEVAVSVAPIRC